MARRKNSDAGGMNLDSLMDTLTNVVGVLIIILILVEINVSRAVKKIVSDLPPVTVEEHTKLKASEKDSVKQLADLKSAQDDAKKIKESLDKANAEFAKLEASAPRDIKLLDIDTLKKQLGDQGKTIEARKAEMEKLLAEQERLQALLEKTPVPVIKAPAPAKVVRIPNARPIPEKAKFARVLVSGGQLYSVDFEAAERLVMNDFNSAKHNLEAQRTKDAKGKPVAIYDQHKVVKLFEQRSLSHNNLNITVPYNKTSTRLVMRLTAKPGLGEPVEAAARITSRFYALLRQAKLGNTVVWFHVARDSFETYIRAREIVDQAGVPAGWEVAWEPTVSQALADFSVVQLEQPPVPKPGAPEVIPIAPPKKTLD